MEEHYNKLQALATPIEAATKQLFSTLLGYDLNSADCTLLASFDFVIKIERADSATEKFLISQHALALATEMGFTINRLIAMKLTRQLANEFSLPIVDVSLLESTLPYQFSLFVLVDQSKMANAQPFPADAHQAG